MQACGTIPSVLFIKPELSLTFLSRRPDYMTPDLLLILERRFTDFASLIEVQPVLP